MKEHISSQRVKSWHFRLSHNYTSGWLVILVVSLVFTYTFLNRGVTTEVAGSPDEDVALFFSQNILETSTFTWHSDLNEELGVSFFRPRLAREIGENTYTGPYPQFELMLAFARLYGVLDYIVGLVAILGVLGVYLLGREIGGNKVGLCSAFIYGFLPPLLLDANKFLSMVPAVSFAILSIFCLLKGVKQHRGAYYCLSAVFLGGATLIRADFALLLVPFAIVLAANLRRITFKYFAAGTITFVVLIVPWYIYFYRVLPMMNTRPFALPLSAHAQTIWENLNSYPFTFLNYMVLNPLPLTIIGLPALVWIVQSHKTTHLRTFAYLSIPLLIVYFLAYGARTGTWGYWTVTPDASMFRYFLLPYAILSVCFAVLLTDRRWWGNLSFTPLILLVLLLPFIVISSTPQLMEERERLQAYADIKNSAAELPENAVLFTKSWDKIVSSGTRDMAVYRTYEELEKDPDLAYFFRAADLDGDILPIVSRLLASGRPVYVLADDNGLAESLQRHGYELGTVPKVGYKVLQPGSSS